MTIFRTHIRLVLIALVLAAFFAFVPHAALAADAPDAIQNPSGCWYNFSFTRCVTNPLLLTSSSFMLSGGGYILRLSGSLFDFGVNQLVIDFQSTLASLQLIAVINAGWSFFRDLANILIIAIFVFVAISLILGLKEYGQKRLIARVLLIAVLMNFSLLFTKIVIDASNFAAYAIYAQTAGNGRAPGPFSIADSVLAPLKVTGVWDTNALATAVFSNPDSGGPLMALMFGILGFFILVALAVVIFYGAFLILARAVILIFLMLTAPLAYATYMAPHFESGFLGWNNWWRALINNAAFAPLLMMFVSISILIMGTASEQIPANDTLGALANNPRLLANGWQVLIVYVLGTGLLFVSFRMASSIAGSISGIRLGQMASALPFTLTGAGAAWVAQRTAGRYYAGQADKKGSELQSRRLQALQTNDPKDWAAVERLRKEKAALDKRASSSFNLFNTRAGKAIAGGAGLAGGLAAGQTKGNFKDDMHARGVAAEERAKQAKVTNDDKKALREQAAKETAAAHEKELADAKAKKEAAEAELVKAKAEHNKVNEDPVSKERLQQDSEAEVTRNSIERAPEVQAARVEIDKVTVEAGNQKATITANFDKQVSDLRKATQDASSSERDEAARKIAKLEADRKSAIDAQDNRIKTAHDKLATINTEIEAPRAALKERQKRAAETIKIREKEFSQAKAAFDKLEGKSVEQVKSSKEAKTLGNQYISQAEDTSKAQIHNIAVDESNKSGVLGTPILGGGAAGAHVIQHHLDEKFKTQSTAQSLAETLKAIKKEEKNDDGPAHA